MCVGSFVICLIGLMRSEIEFSVLKLLKKAGYDVVVPPARTRCGQPAYNPGGRLSARDLAEKTLGELERFDYVVIPSGSCDDMIRKSYVDLFRDNSEFADRYRRLAPCVYELTDFLVNVACIEALDSGSHDHVTYHDSCSGLCELGMRAQLRELLRKLPGMQLAEMPTCEVRCGFNGTPSIKYGGTSTAIADERRANIKASGADAVMLGDVGCMLNIEGRLHRTGDTYMHALHIAQVLAGGA